MVNSVWYWDGFTYEWYIQYYQTQPELVANDPWFGKYTTNSQTLDTSSSTYPNMLLCFAAGNDRNDGGPSLGQDWYIYKTTSPAGWVLMDGSTYPAPNPDEGFDTIDTTASSKNTISVGASIDSSGETSTFSGWGTTDDGRIKPEVVANGLSVYSCTNTTDTSYSISSGTSMACPFVSGSAIIIQQFIQEKLGYTPLSSTMKALIIHGASVDEIPADVYVSGKHGYGVINMNNTLRVLDNVYQNVSGFHVYNNETMTNSDTEKTYSYTNLTNKSLVVTLCWTDLPGTGNDSYFKQSFNDKSIVNRLGLYLKHTDTTNGSETFYYPYRVYSQEENATMETSNDTLDESKIISYDNTQKILIRDTIMSGDLTVYVKRDNILNGNQNYSLIVSVDSEPSCIVKGTKICKWNEQEEMYEFCNIENLKEGDFVKTYQEDKKRIKYLKKEKIINGNGKNNMHELDVNIKSTCNSFELYKIQNDVILTAGHSILVNELNERQEKSFDYIGKNKKIKDKFACLTCFYPNAVKIENNQVYTIFHIVLESDSIHEQYGIYASEKDSILIETMSIDWYEKTMGVSK